MARLVCITGTATMIRQEGYLCNLQSLLKQKSWYARKDTEVGIPPFGQSAKAEWQILEEMWG